MISTELLVTESKLIKRKSNLLINQSKLLVSNSKLIVAESKLLLKKCGYSKYRVSKFPFPSAPGGLGVGNPQWGGLGEIFPQEFKKDLSNRAGDKLSKWIGRSRYLTYSK